MAQLRMYWCNQPLNSAQLPEGYSIRTYREGDEQGWIDVCADGLDTGSWMQDDFHEKMLEQEGIKPEGIFFITDEKGRIAGTATGLLKDTPGFGYVHMVSIHPDFRGLGLAKSLNAAVMKYLSDRGRTNIYLDTDDFRIPAIKSYLYMGFLPILHTYDMEERWLKIMETLGLSQLPTYSKGWESSKVLSLKNTEGEFQVKKNQLNEMPIGIIIPLENVLKNGIGELEELGLSVCQLCCWDTKFYTRENADKLTRILKDKIRVTSLWVGWPPPAIWNFIDGPLTLGLVPKEFRYLRMDCLKQGADFASMIGVADIVTHVGFIPENPSTTEYREVVIAIREVAQYCKQKGIFFNFETGQETPITLKRTMEDVGLDNLGVNLDPANLLLYGKANPVDAIDIYGKTVRSVHVKDGRYPTNGRELGQEMPVGEGMVNFPELIRKLRNYGYDGPLIIEREISGPQQKIDVLRAKELLLSILKEE